MSNNTGIDKRDLSYTPPENERFRVMPSTGENPKKPLPGPFPTIQVEGQQKIPYFDGLRENERSLISNNEKKKGGSLKRKNRLSYKNKKRITRKMRKSHRNKKHK